MRRRDLLLASLALLAVWQLLAMLLRQAILPSPVAVAVALKDELIRGELPRHFLASLWRVVASTALSIGLAAPAGLLLGQSKRLSNLFMPVYLHPLPDSEGGIPAGAAAVLWHRRNIEDPDHLPDFFFQILVLVRDQAAALRPELILSVRSLGAGRRALFRYVYLPASLPGILTALRQSIGTAVAVLYVAEVFATRLGLGYYIYFQGSTLLNYPAMYAGIVAMSLLGLSLYFLVDWLEKKLCRWQTR